MAERESVVEAQRWGDDPNLVELLGAQGAAEFRALFDAFPEAVGVLWALRNDEGRIVDFTFGYGNPSILRAFRLPPATRDRYTLLQALPRMRGSRAFDAYIRVCESGEPWVQESILGSTFTARYRWLDKSAGKIAPTITGTAYVNAESTLLLDERDPFCWGIKP